MHQSHGESVNLNPKMDRGELPPLDFTPPDPAVVAAGRRAIEEINRQRVESRVELWHGVSVSAA